MKVLMKVMIGSGVTAPILRYNPAIIAQAFATLGYMYPGRVFLGLGNGESMNEYVTGYEWPTTKERLRDLKKLCSLFLKYGKKNLSRLTVNILGCGALTCTQNRLRLSPCISPLAHQPQPK
jgi:hypothetical protein